MYGLAFDAYLHIHVQSIHMVLVCRDTTEHWARVCAYYQMYNSMHAASNKEILKRVMCSDLCVLELVLARYQYQNSCVHA
jgi:hypothetical protein